MIICVTESATDFNLLFQRCAATCRRRKLNGNRGNGHRAFGVEVGHALELLRMRVVMIPDCCKSVEATTKKVSVAPEVPIGGSTRSLSR